MKALHIAVLAAGLFGAAQAGAAPVIWTNWTSGTAGATGSAAGAIDLGPAGADASDIAVS